MIYLIALLVYVLDQGMKWIVKTHMTLGSEIPIWHNIVVLDYIRNPGAAFSILPNQRWLLVLIAVIVISAVIYFQRKFRFTGIARVGLGFLLGGALGNLTDRVLTGTVVDYVYIKAINFPVFNLADVSIDVGVALLLLYSFRRDGMTVVEESMESDSGRKHQDPSNSKEEAGR